MDNEHDPRYLLNKRLIREAFDKAAQSYDEAAVLQREVATRMLERLDYIKADPRVILDIGSGTGFVSQWLEKQYPEATIYSLDLSEAMLKQCRQRRKGAKSGGVLAGLRSKFSKKHHQYICGDAEQLPLADGSVDMIVSNLTIQWCQDLDAVFNEFRRVSHTGGLILYSTFGPDTLKELKQSWAAVDDRVHVNAFLDMHDIGDAMVRAQWENPVMDTEVLTLTYDDTMTLLKDLKGIGAQNKNAGRSEGLTSPKKLKAMLAAYEQFRNADNKLPATYEVVYGHAWVPELMQQQSDGNVTKISLSQMKQGIKPKD